MQRLAPIVLVLLLAACGSSSNSTTSTGAAPPQTTPDPAAAVGGKTLYRGGAWAVVVDGSHAVALHLIRGTWHPDRSGKVKVEFLGPHGTAAPTPQVAAQLSARSPLVESALWVDGRELTAKGGGLTPTRGTIYGAPDAPLASGKHVAVAYARTATAATAIATSFQVK
jgi:hypothetical protein